MSNAKSKISSNYEDELASMITNKVRDKAIRELKKSGVIDESNMMLFNYVFDATGLLMIRCLSHQYKRQQKQVTATMSIHSGDDDDFGIDSAYSKALFFEFASYDSGAGLGTELLIRQEDQKLKEKADQDSDVFVYAIAKILLAHFYCKGNDENVIASSGVDEYGLEFKYKVTPVN